ncbi:MAG TPA: hypothetical protein VGB69_03125, partial [Edaphobacter sp.]
NRATSPPHAPPETSTTTFQLVMPLFDLSFRGAAKESASPAAEPQMTGCPILSGSFIVGKGGMNPARTCTIHL